MYIIRLNWNLAEGTTGKAQDTIAVGALGLFQGLDYQEVWVQVKLRFAHIKGWIWGETPQVNTRACGSNGLIVAPWFNVAAIFLQDQNQNEKEIPDTVNSRSRFLFLF